MMRKVQTIVLLLGMKHPEADAMIGEIIRTSDFHTAYHVLQKTLQELKSDTVQELFGLSNTKDRFDALLEKGRGTHGELIDLTRAVIDRRERERGIIRLRSAVTGDEHRFFLALLLNVPGREHILRLVKQRFPEGDPVEKVLDWVDELAQMRVLGSKASILGIEGYGPQHSFALECVLRGDAPEAARAKARAEGLDVDIEKLQAALRESLLLRELF
jgi:hypothetical protein